MAFSGRNIVAMEHVILILRSPLATPPTWLALWRWPTSMQTGNWTCLSPKPNLRSRSPVLKHAHAAVSRCACGRRFVAFDKLHHELWVNDGDGTFTGTAQGSGGAQSPHGLSNDDHVSAAVFADVDGSGSLVRSLPCACVSVCTPGAAVTHAGSLRRKRENRSSVAFHRRQAHQPAVAVREPSPISTCPARAARL